MLPLIGPSPPLFHALYVYNTYKAWSRGGLHIYICVKTCPFFFFWNVAYRVFNYYYYYYYYYEICLVIIYCLKGPIHGDLFWAHPWCENLWPSCDYLSFSSQDCPQRCRVDYDIF